MTAIKVFWLEPTDDAQHELRRFSLSDEKCTAKPYGMTCHDARVQLGVLTGAEFGRFSAQEESAEPWKSERVTRDDSRWPTRCQCGYQFKADDHWQDNFIQLYEARGGPHDGSRFTLRECPVGAMWDASWLPRHRPWIGFDGIALMVRTPNDWDWHVDGHASNCDRSDDKQHYCWCRHGNPKMGDVHVDKLGDTCNAGAGSILSPTWHGFLHGGYLVTC